jgi:hypothetical protein
VRLCCFVTIFSLALMGSNFTDHVREAHRCLAIDGRLHIIEATSRFKDLGRFAAGLHKLGFDIIDKPEERGLFTFVQVTKSERKPQTDIKLSL